MLWYENFDLDTLITPVDPDKFEELLNASSYDPKEIKFLIEGFRNGFDIGYAGPQDVRLESNNLRLTVGNETELWNKVMAEVKEGRFAGPFRSPPFKNYIQSPIGLVPKDGGRKTRLIFHLSHPRKPKNGELSVNAGTPPDLCSVKYKDFDWAIQLCLLAGKGCHLGKSDMSHAFRNLCLSKESWKYLVMKAKCPLDGKFYYFVDKCLPFGAAISCSHFQRFSNAVAHLVKFRANLLHEPVNYLDDFLFIALLLSACNTQIQTFLDICDEIKFPVALEKTFWATTLLTFLGLMIDTERQLVLLPLEKINKAVNLIDKVLARNSKKLRVIEVQQITGLLNFFREMYRTW